MQDSAPIEIVWLQIERGPYKRAKFEHDLVDWKNLQ